MKKRIRSTESRNCVNHAIRSQLQDWNNNKKIWSVTSSDRNTNLGKIKNIAGRLPENSRNRFVDRPSKKNSKKDRPKKFAFSLKADLLYYD